MSAVIKTTVPFLDVECLLLSLDLMGVAYSQTPTEIITERVDYQGNQKFILTGEQFLFQYDSYQGVKKNYKNWQTVGSFLSTLDKHYRVLYAEKLLKEDNERLEAQRKAFVEKQKTEIIKRAKAKGYSVKEKLVKNKIKLVLVKNTY